jgi:hypothetical protein
VGQSVFDSGLCKVGLPGAELGMRKEGPGIASLPDAEGQPPGQVGKNHTGRPRRAPADQPRLRRVALPL